MKIKIVSFFKNKILKKSINNLTNIKKINKKQISFKLKKNSNLIKLNNKTKIISIYFKFHYFDLIYYKYLLINLIKFLQ